VSFKFDLLNPTESNKVKKKDAELCVYCLFGRRQNTDRRLPEKGNVDSCGEGLDMKNMWLRTECGEGLDMKNVWLRTECGERLDVKNLWVQRECGKMSVGVRSDKHWLAELCRFWLQCSRILIPNTRGVAASPCFHYLTHMLFSCKLIRRGVCGTLATR
jgi:hypothetical protein